MDRREEVRRMAMTWLGEVTEEQIDHIIAQADAITWTAIADDGTVTYAPEGAFRAVVTLWAAEAGIDPEFAPISEAVRVLAAIERAGFDIVPHAESTPLP